MSRLITAACLTFGLVACARDGFDQADLSGLDFSQDAVIERLATPGWSNCRFPAAGNDAQIILFGAYEGDAVSNVALADVNEETGVIDVVIEPGDQPLYIILTALQHTIWRFSGATERVEQVALVGSDGSHPPPPPPPPPSSAAPAAEGSDVAVITSIQAPRRPYEERRLYLGAVGLSAERVSTTGVCFGYFHESGARSTQTAVAAIERILGRAPDVVAGQYSLAAIRLPSGLAAEGARVMPTPPSHDPRYWDSVLRFKPAGLTDIDPEDVISAVAAIEYDVLPNETGVTQLLGSGHLELTEAGLTIVRPIPHFPAGMGGAHALTFYLRDGVAMPPGDFGHSCVKHETTDEMLLPGAACRISQ